MLPLINLGLWLGGGGGGGGGGIPGCPPPLYETQYSTKIKNDSFWAYTQYTAPIYRYLHDVHVHVHEHVYALYCTYHSLWPVDEDGYILVGQHDLLKDTAQSHLHGYLTNHPALLRVLGPHCILQLLQGVVEKEHTVVIFTALSSSSSSSSLRAKDQLEPLKGGWNGDGEGNGLRGEVICSADMRHHR